MEHLTLYGVYKISDFATPTELDRLEGVYHRFMQIMGWGDIMTFFLPPAPPERWQDNLNRDVVMGGMTLTRPDRSFTERDRLILNLLHPHLIQAFQTALKFQQHQVVPQIQESIDCLGIIFLDDSGSVTQFTSQATRWLDRYFPSSRLQPCEPAIGLISGSVNLAPYINSIAILDYLDRVYPYPSMTPATPAAVGKMRMVQMVTSNEIMSTFAPVIKHQGQIPAEHPKAATLSAGLTFLETELGDGDYFGGKTIDLADCVAGVTLSLLRRLGVDCHAHPRVNAWLDRLAARSSWQQTEPSDTDFDRWRRYVSISIQRAER